MGKYSKEYETNSSGGAWTEFIGGAIFFFIFIIFALADYGIFDSIGEWFYNLTPRNYYTTEIKIDEGDITQKVTENGKYYIKILNSNILDNNSWVEVKSGFYNLHDTSYYSNNKVGLLLCKSDVYKGRFWGIFSKETPVFEKTIWQIAEVYDSYYAAVTANPHEIKTVQGKVYKKKSLDGKNYIVIDVEGNKIKEEVDQIIFNRYEVNSPINCKFECWGDLREFKGII
ncbi:MAG: hypothetical protein ACM3UU_10075 [Ignavibacteriales bacterium]